MSSYQDHRGAVVTDDPVYLGQSVARASKTRTPMQDGVASMASPMFSRQRRA